MHCERVLIGYVCVYWNGIRYSNYIPRLNKITEKETEKKQPNLQKYMHIISRRLFVEKICTRGIFRLLQSVYFINHCFNQSVFTFVCVCKLCFTYYDWRKSVLHLIYIWFAITIFKDMFIIASTVIGLSFYVSDWFKIKWADSLAY